MNALMEPVTFPTYLKDYTGANCELAKSTSRKIKYIHFIKNPSETVQEVLERPDAVYRSNHKEDHHLYYKKISGTNFYHVVVVDTTQKRVDTAYKADRIKKGDLIWTNSSNTV